MARPLGRFDKQKEECLVWIKTVMKPKCFASNKYLAAKLKCSERQVSRYLKALEEEGKIVRTRYRYSRKGSLKTKRFVSLKGKWLPALVAPANRFVGYIRKGRMEDNKHLEPEKVIKREPTKEEIAQWYKQLGLTPPKEQPVPTMDQRRAAELRYLARPKLAGVVYSAGLQAIIDKLPNKG